MSKSSHTQCRSGSSGIYFYFVWHGNMPVGSSWLLGCLESLRAFCCTRVFHLDSPDPQLASQRSRSDLTLPTWRELSAGGA